MDNSSTYVEERNLELIYSKTPVTIKGKAYTWEQGGVPPWEAGSREWGNVVVCSELMDPTITIAMLMEDYLFHKARSFPEWTGKPLFRVGPTTFIATLVREDGTDIEKSVQEAWDEHTLSRDLWNELNPVDMYPFNFFVPMGYSIKRKKLRHFGWYAIV